LKFAFSLLKTDEMAKLVGIMAHFVYWSVFGGFNPLHIDNYHMDKMLRSILEQKEIVEKKFTQLMIEDFEHHRKRKEKEKGEFQKVQHHSRHLTEE
jgi:hypothetical protein